MHTLELTDTVRGLLSNEGATTLLTYLRSIEGCITLTDLYGQTSGQRSEWLLDCTRHTVTSLVLLKTEEPPEAPMTVEVKFALPPGSVRSDVPEEHRQLIIHKGKVWTFGDLAFQDVNHFFRGLECRLSPAAYNRMHERLLRLCPVGYWERPFWPDDLRRRWAEMQRDWA